MLQVANTPQPAQASRSDALLSTCFLVVHLVMLPASLSIALLPLAAGGQPWPMEYKPAPHLAYLA